MKSEQSISGFEPAAISGPVHRQKYPLGHLAHEIILM